MQRDGNRNTRKEGNLHLPELHSSDVISFFQCRSMQRVIGSGYLAVSVMHGGDGLQQRAAVVQRRSHAENLHRLFRVNMPNQLPLHVQTVAADDGGIDG